MPRAVLALLLAAVVAQAPPRQVFRGASVLVYVDVYPTRDGQVVSGLTPADFRIDEDGTPQQVEGLEFIHVDPHPADSERKDPNTPQEGDRLAGDPHHRAFVLYFDVYHLATLGARNLREPVKDFLERVIGPTDYVAALTPDVPPDRLMFGQRLETLERAIDDYWRQVADVTGSGLAYPQSAQEQMLETCYIGRTSSAQANEAIVKQLLARWRLDLVLDGIEGLAGRLANIRDERTNVLLLSGGWTLGGPDATLEQYAWGAETQPAFRDGRLRSSGEHDGAPAKSACDAELFRLASLDFRTRFLEVIAATKRVNMSISTIDPTGLGAYDFDMSVNRGITQMDVQPKLDTLRTLSENTGGLAVVSTNDLRTPLHRLAEEVSSVLPSDVLLDEYEVRRQVPYNRRRGEGAAGDGDGAQGVSGADGRRVARTIGPAPSRCGRAGGHRRGAGSARAARRDQRHLHGGLGGCGLGQRRRGNRRPTDGRLATGRRRGHHVDRRERPCGGDDARADRQRVAKCVADASG